MSHQGTIKRYTLILEKLKSNTAPAADEILSFLEDTGLKTSKRTLERDFEAIRNEFSIEIEYNRARRGYMINEEKSVDIPSFFRFLEIVNTADLLTESLKDGSETLTYLSFDQAGGMKGLHWLKDLLFAIKERRKIKIKHFNFHKEKHRSFGVQPYLLKEYQNRWYLVGWVSGLNQLRTFGVDRIDELKVTDQFFERDQKLNVKEKFEQTIGLVFSTGKPERVELSFVPEQAHYVKSLPFHSSQKILEDSDDCLRIELRVVLNYELLQQICMHNDKVKVLAPERLKEEHKEVLRRALKAYGEG